MKRNYLPITVIVFVMGVGLTLYPQTLEIRLGDEVVVTWRGSAATEATGEGRQRFSFRTGLHHVDGGFGPTLVLSNSADAPMNATVTNIADPSAPSDPANETAPMLVYYMGEAGGYDLAIDGHVAADDTATVNTTFYHYMHVEPERITVYPYRYFGMGMAAVGLVATGVAHYYNRKQDELATSPV